MATDKTIVLITGGIQEPSLKSIAIAHTLLRQQRDRLRSRRPIAHRQDQTRNPGQPIARERRGSHQRLAVSQPPGDSRATTA